MDTLIINTLSKYRHRLYSDILYELRRGNSYGAIEIEKEVFNISKILHHLKHGGNYE